MSEGDGPAPRVALDFLRLAEPYLARHGSPSPRLDAEVLLAHVLGTSRLELYARLDQPLTRAEVDAYREALRRRAAREPVAYIVGSREFYGLRFAVGPGVLVPRPETEYLVELCLRALGGAASCGAAGHLRFVDVGTGAGVLAVTLAVRRPDIRGVGSDVSHRALGYAAENGRALGAGDRVRWVRGDTLAWAAEGSFDLAVSNPPYVPTGQIAALAPEIRRYEPREALDGGPDGLRVARRIVEQAAGVLRPGGLLVMELASTAQARTLAEECRRAGGYARAAAVQDAVTGVPALVAQAAGDGRLAWPVVPAEEAATP